MTGFENGSAAVAGTVSGIVGVVEDEGARSGNGYLYVNRPTAGTTTTGWTPTLSGYVGSIATGKVGECRCRFFLKVGSYPSANNAIVFQVDSTLRFAVVMDTTGHVAAAGNGAVGSYSATAVPLATWTQVDVYITFTNQSTATDTFTVSVTVGGGVGIVSLTQTNQSLGGSTFLAPTFGPGASTLSTTVDFCYDDVVLTIDDNLAVPGLLPALPTSTRITLVQITGQGASAGWSGTWYNVLRNGMSNSAATPTITQTGAGADRTFLHESAADLGLSAIQAITVYAIVGYATSQTPTFLWNGGTLSSESGTFSTVVTNGVQPRASDWSALTTAQFDAAEIGIRSSAAGLNTLYALWAEVLHNGTARPLRNTSETDGGTDRHDSYTHAFGTYTGDGSQRHAITGLGFRPHCVRVWSRTGAFAVDMGVLKHRWMAGASAVQLGGTVIAGSNANGWNDVVSLDADGFTLGSATTVNGTGTAYVYLAIRDGGNPDPTTDESGFYFKMGSFIGNGADDRNVPILDAASWTPDLLVGTRGSSATWFWRQAEMTGDLTADLSTVTSNRVQAFTATGFQIGTSTTVVSSAAKTYWIAWRRGVGLVAAVLSGSFTGSSADVTIVPNAALTDLELVSVLSVFGSNVGYFKSRLLHTGTTSQRFDQGSSTTTLEDLTGTSFRTNGGSVVNVNGQTSYWFGFARHANITGASVEVTFEPSISFGPVFWAELSSPDGTTPAVSAVDLPDPSTYYQGFKQGIVLTPPVVIRALSDENGDYESQTFNFEVDDSNRYFRGLTGNLYNRRVVLRMIDEPSWRERGTPRTVAIGLIRNFAAS